VQSERWQHIGGTGQTTQGFWQIVVANRIPTLTGGVVDEEHVKKRTGDGIGDAGAMAG
jgi:hypothetical protein